jgi:hypothetical protein
MIGGAAAVAAPMMCVRNSYNLGEQFAVAQPVAFDHRHHAQGDGINCRYCHRTVDKAAAAGIPATAVCMDCHSQILSRASLVEPIRRSYFSDTPIGWNPVYELPDTCISITRFM